jgi:hypothetical protein
MGLLIYPTSILTTYQVERMVFETPIGAETMKPSFPGLTPDSCFLPHHLRNDADGYPIITNGKGGKSLGHRIAYRSFCGAIPSTSMVLHACGNAQCVNPHHLYLGDAAQNARDRAAHGRTAIGAKLPQTKLTDVDVMAIRGSAKRVTDLARDYGISKGCVSSIRSLRSRVNVQSTAQKVGG